MSAARLFQICYLIGRFEPGSSVFFNVLRELTKYRVLSKKTSLFESIVFQHQAKLEKILWRSVTIPLPGSEVSRVLKNINLRSRTIGKRDMDNFLKTWNPGIFYVYTAIRCTLVNWHSCTFAHHNNVSPWNLGQELWHKNALRAKKEYRHNTKQCGSWLETQTTPDMVFRLQKLIL